MTSQHRKLLIDFIATAEIANEIAQCPRCRRWTLTEVTDGAIGMCMRCAELHSPRERYTADS